VNENSVTTPERPNSAWLITFVDLVGLIVIFFILLYAMSEVEREKWQGVSTTLSRVLGFDTGVARSTGLPELATPARGGYGANLEYLAAVLERRLAEDDALAGVTIRRPGDGLAIALPSGMLFRSGEAVLSEDGERLVSALARLLRNVRNRVEVVDYGVPLSLAAGWVRPINRALAVRSGLLRAGYAKGVAAYGRVDPYGGAADGATGRDSAQPRLEVIVREMMTP